MKLRDSFSLSFPPIPKDIKSIDFIEGDCDDCFKIWDIDLTGKGAKFVAGFPQEVTNQQIDKTATLPPVELKSGKTTVNVHLSGLREGYVYQHSGFPGIDKLKEEFSKVW